MHKEPLTMKVLKEKFGVCRLNKAESIPTWTQNSEFLSITKTLDELSIVCSQNTIPSDIKCEKNLRVLKIEESLDFSLIGVLHSISEILVNEGISIFAISTYDTNYILVKDKDLNNSIAALLKENYKIFI